MYIAIEGLIGIGKSSLQNILLHHYHGEELVQDFASHHYLEKYYSNIPHFARETMLIFLFMADHQVRNLNDNCKLIIADFVPEKCEAFSRLVLPAQEFSQLYKVNHDYLLSRTPKPDVLIWLQGTPQLALERIKQRNRSMEQNMPISYLQQLEQSYQQTFHAYKGAPMLKVNIAERDFLYNPTDVDQLLQELESLLPRLRSFRKA